jgi:hypothetical protein
MIIRTINEMKEDVQKQVGEIREYEWTVKWIQWECKETTKWTQRGYK